MPTPVLGPGPRQAHDERRGRLRCSDVPLAQTAFLVDRRRGRPRPALPGSCRSAGSTPTLAPLRRDRLPGRRLLVLVRREGGLLDRLNSATGVWRPPVSPPTARAPPWPRCSDPKGCPVAALFWDPETPGQTVRRWLVPALAAACLVFAGFAALALRSIALATAALRHSERRFRDIVEAASDWIWETDSELRLTFVSARFGGAAGRLRRSARAIWANPCMPCWPMPARPTAGSSMSAISPPAASSAAWSAGSTAAVPGRARCGSPAARRTTNGAASAAIGASPPTSPPSSRPRPRPATRRATTR